MEAARGASSEIATKNAVTRQSETGSQSCDGISEWGQSFRNLVWAGLAVLVGGVAGAVLSARADTGEPGSPSATTTIDGKQLPPPPEKFGGVIKDDAYQSQPWWPPKVVPPKGAPQHPADHDRRLRLRRAEHLWRSDSHAGFGPRGENGFAVHAVSFHGALFADAHGADYRAQSSLGRLRRRGGTGTGFPGYDSFIGAESATIGTILRDHGYATSWFGKDHNTPSFQASQVGPFDQWPCGMGFEYFYGFVGGDTSQWQPNLFRNTTAIYPYVGKPKWNLITAMADDAIEHLKMLNELDPAKPFFCYYVPGAAHAPHQPTPEWIKKISDMHLFDKGWNALAKPFLRTRKSWA